MNWANLFGIIYLAAHTVAGLMSLILWGILFDIQKLGPVVWVVPAACMVLLGLDLTRRLNLKGSMQKTLAALAFPGLCGCGDVVLCEDKGRFLGVLGCIISLLFLSGYVLLGKEKTASPLSKAEVLLSWGSNLYVVEVLWLMMAAGAVLFMATFGMLISLIVGGLIASKNGLLDYGGVKGLLLGLLGLYFLQCLWYWRGVRLVRRAAPDLDNSTPLIALFVPIWNLLLAHKLLRRLQLRGVKDFY